MSDTDRWIFHVDMDAFYASVEQRDSVHLRGEPVIVGAPPDKRGVVCTASYEAREFGVHSAMPSRTAHRLCPHAHFMPVRMQQYRDVSHQLFGVFRAVTSQVEGLSVDEAFLDVTDQVSSAEEAITLAESLKAQIWHEIGLTASIGIAPNKLLAKLASDLQKPNGLTFVPREPAAISAMLAPLSLQRLWGIGPKSAVRLERCGLRKVADVQRCGAEALTGLLGQEGAERLFALSHGIDQRPVSQASAVKSISNENTFGEDCGDLATIEACLLGLAVHVAERVKDRSYLATTVVLKLRWADFRTITRQITLSPGTDHERPILRAAFRLLRTHWDQAALRLIGIGVTVVPPATGEYQPELFDLTLPLSSEDAALDVEIVGMRQGRE